MLTKRTARYLVLGRKSCAYVEDIYLNESQVTKMAIIERLITLLCDKWLGKIAICSSGYGSDLYCILI